MVWLLPSDGLLIGLICISTYLMNSYMWCCISKSCYWLALMPNLPIVLKLLVWHIQTCFYLCRRFHRFTEAPSSVLMTLDDVIIHERKFVIALVSACHCVSVSTWSLLRVFSLCVTPCLPHLLPPSIWYGFRWLYSLGWTCWWWIATASFRSSYFILSLHHLHLSCVHLVWS